MSESLDLVSSCCRAPVEHHMLCLTCDKCGKVCAGNRHDRVPASYDPPREKWTRKPEFITRTMDFEITPRDPLEPR